MNQEEDVVSIDFTIHGKVQGVFFRKHTRQQGRRAARAGASVEGRTFGEDSQLEPLGNERMKLPLTP